MLEQQESQPSPEPGAQEGKEGHGHPVAGQDIGDPEGGAGGAKAQATPEIGEEGVKGQTEHEAPEEDVGDEERR